MFFYLTCNSGNINTNLVSRVAVAQCNGIFFERFKVYGDAKWSTNLILPAITLSNIAVVIKYNLWNLLTERLKNFRGPLNKFVVLHQARLLYKLQVIPQAKFFQCQMSVRSHEEQIFR